MPGLRKLHEGLRKLNEPVPERSAIAGTIAHGGPAESEATLLQI